MTAAPATAPEKKAESLDLKATPKDPGFQALDLPKGTEVSQALKASEGSRLTEPFHVAGALARSVFRAAYQIYDNARTDIRVGNAAKEMGKFDPEKIATGASAKAILDKWSEMANLGQNKAIKAHMDGLGKDIGNILNIDSRVASIKENIDNALKTAIGEKTLNDFVGAKGAENFTSLTPQQKQQFLVAYGELRNNLSQLNSVAQSADAQARAFYESSVERMKVQASFKLGKDAAAFYRSGLTALHNEHVKALEALTGKDATPEQIREVGNNFTAKLKELQEKTTSLSASLKSAAAVERKVKETLEYLTKGVDSNKAIGVSDKSVVFVGADAADKIAAWVTAQTEGARNELAEAKNANNPAAIADATEKLEAASKVVHKQLDDIASLLTKVNGGLDKDRKPTQDQKERILAKVTDADKAGASEHLEGYVKSLRDEMESRIATMFTPIDGKYDLEASKGALRTLEKSSRLLEEAIATYNADGVLTANEVKSAVDLARTELEKALRPKKTEEERKMEESFKAAQAKIDKEMNPPKSLWGRFTGWLFAK